MLGTAQEEQAKSDKMWTSQEASTHREQWERDFGLWAGDPFRMPKGSGAWDEVTTNTATVHGNKVVNLLSASAMKLFIDIDDEGKADRKKLTNAEYLANGVIAQADEDLTGIPENKSIQDSLSYFASIRAGTAKSVYLYEEEEDGEKKVCGEIKIYDSMYCQWISGEKSLVWFCYRYYVTKDWLESTFKDYIKKNHKDGFDYGKADDGKADDGKVLCYFLCDDMSWKVSCNGEYISEIDHNLGYVPVKIDSVGAAPYVQRSTGDASTRHLSWRSVYADDRDFYPLHSKMLTILNSKATDAARTVVSGEFDSTKGEAPEGIQKLGSGQSKDRNVVLMFDVGKGQRMGDIIQPPPAEVVERFNATVQRQLIIGSIDPVASGQMTGPGSGALASILINQALEYIHPFKKRVEDDLAWIANEITRQFVNGNFTSISVYGRDAKNKAFETDIKQSDVELKRFTCHLVPDKLRDATLELGNAIQKVNNQITSRRTALLQGDIVEDPDAEDDRIHEEMAKRDPVYMADLMALQFHEEGNDRMAGYWKNVAEGLIIKQAMETEQLKQALQLPAAGATQPQTPDNNPAAISGAAMNQTQAGNTSSLLAEQQASMGGQGAMAANQGMMGGMPPGGA